MKFLVSRTSNWKSINRGQKPCERAYKERADWFIDVDSLEELMGLARLGEHGLILNRLDPAWHWTQGVEFEAEIYDYYPPT